MVIESDHMRIYSLSGIWNLLIFAKMLILFLIALKMFWICHFCLRRCWIYNIILVILKILLLSLWISYLWMGVWIRQEVLLPSHHFWRLCNSMVIMNKLICRTIWDLKFRQLLFHSTKWLCLMRWRMKRLVFAIMKFNILSL